MSKKTLPAVDEPADPNAGMGGSYRVDPKTGKRELLERTVTIVLEPSPPPNAQVIEAMVDSILNPEPKH